MVYNVHAHHGIQRVMATFARSLVRMLALKGRNVVVGYRRYGAYWL